MTQCLLKQSYIVFPEIQNEPCNWILGGSGILLFGCIQVACYGVDKLRSGYHGRSR